MDVGVVGIKHPQFSQEIVPGPSKPQRLARRGAGVPGDGVKILCSED